MKHKRINSFPFILLLVSTIDSKMNHFVYSMFIFFLIFKFNNYFYNIIIYGMHEFKSQKLIKTRFQMNKIRLGKIVLQDNQYPFRIEHTFHSNHTPCLSHYASNASHSCTQHNSWTDSFPVFFSVFRYDIRFCFGLYEFWTSCVENLPRSCETQSLWVISNHIYCKPLKYKYKKQYLLLAAQRKSVRVTHFLDLQCRLVSHSFLIFLKRWRSKNATAFSLSGRNGTINAITIALNIKQLKGTFILLATT